jgi:AraC family transcriptional regulator of adaptative response/methylated-DNA-[protein]-cysteine methyltransferase
MFSLWLEYEDVFVFMHMRQRKKGGMKDFRGTQGRYDFIVTIDRLTPDECGNNGESLTLNYGFAESPLGKILLASTRKGVCRLVFGEDEAKALKELRKCFPCAVFRRTTDTFQQKALRVFDRDSSNLQRIILHLKGTDFQLKVWEALLKIPRGQLSTYGEIARRIGRPKAVRAVGTAVGKNPVAFLIPCHRVIRATGALGRYRWGNVRKKAMIEWERLDRTY